MYQIKIHMTDNWSHSYVAEDSAHVETLRQCMINKFPIELKSEETGERLIINTDRIIAISITEIKETENDN